MNAVKRMKLKELALNSIDDLVANFAYYDRKDDEELSSKDLEILIDGGYLTRDEIVERWAKAVDKWLVKK